MLLYASLSLFVVLVNSFAHAQGRIKITATDVVVEENSHYGQFGYSARFEVRVEDEREIWICDIGKVDRGGVTWANCNSKYPTEGKLFFKLQSPDLEFKKIFDDPGPLVEKNPYISGPHIDWNPIHPVNRVKKRLDRVEARGDLNIAVAYWVDNDHDLIRYEESIPAKSLEFNGKSERGQYLFRSEEVFNLGIRS